MDALAIDLSYNLKSMNAKAVPLNSIGPTEWDNKEKKSKGILSLKHAGELAGMGKIGKNTLLINDKYGIMIWLSAVLTSMKLEPDPITTYEGCIKDCTLCLDNCPVKALDGISIIQSKC